MASNKYKELTQHWNSVRQHFKCGNKIEYVGNEIIMILILLVYNNMGNWWQKHKLYGQCILLPKMFVCSCFPSSSNNVHPHIEEAIFQNHFDSFPSFFLADSQQITDCVCQEYDTVLENFYSLSDSASFQMMKLLVPHMDSLLQVEAIRLSYEIGDEVKIYKSCVSYHRSTHKGLRFHRRNAS